MYFFYSYLQWKQERKKKNKEDRTKWNFYENVLSEHGLKVELQDIHTGEFEKMGEGSGEWGKEINKPQCPCIYLYIRMSLPEKKKRNKNTVSFFVIIECIILICTITFIYPELYIGNASWRFIVNHRIIHIVCDLIAERVTWLV